jgi:hypothetical protein
MVAASLPPASYSDTPFDAFVCFSNVIVRPFFQNYLKRKEVSRKTDALIASISHMLILDFHRDMKIRDTTCSKKYSN